MKGINTKTAGTLLTLTHNKYIVSSAFYGASFYALFTVRLIVNCKSEFGGVCL